MELLRGAIARRLIFSFAALSTLALALAIGAFLLVQLTNRTLSQVASQADVVALSARIRAESLTLTSLVQRYTFPFRPQVTIRDELENEIAVQHAGLNVLLQELTNITDPADSAERAKIARIEDQLLAFLTEVNHVLDTYQSEGSHGPATYHEMDVLITQYQLPLMTTLQELEQFEMQRVQTVRARAHQTVQNILIGLGITALVVTFAALFAGQLALRRIITSLMLLRRGVEAFRLGQLDQPVQVSGQDEMGRLGDAFNAMAAELQQSRLQLEDYAHTLEERVAGRTAELQQANRTLSQRAVQLEISSQVGQQVTSILEMDTLLAHVVTLIQGRFGYYFVGIWLLSDQQNDLVLHAGAKRSGTGPLEYGARIPVEADNTVAWVCRSGQYRLIDDVNNTPDYKATDRLPNTQSELTLPLRGKVMMGVLDIQSDQPAAFSPEDRMVLQTLADQIAIALRNAQLYEMEQQRRRLAESLEKIGRELSSSLDMRQVPGRILEQLEAVVPYERGAVMLQQDDKIQIIAQQGFPQDEQALQLSLPIRQDDVFQQVVSARQAVLVDDVTQTSSWQQVDWLPVNRSWMGVPLISKGRVIGMISLTRLEAGAFDPQDATLASTFAGQAAIALENASLYDEIKHFNEQLEQMVQERTEELNQAYHILERLDKTKSEFIEVAAHELRTPLTVIRGYTQVLESKHDLGKDNDSKELLNGILSGAERLHQVVNSMLDVTKIDSQALKVHWEHTSVSEVIEGVRAGFANALDERRLALRTEGLDRLPPVPADPSLLQKVFYHLIVNAIKYTPDGGSILVTGRVIMRKDSASPDPGAAWVEIIVSDTGIGIDPAHHTLIFEKFYQTGEVALHSSGKVKFKGSGPGLGLAIARGIVQAHGGQIWVESAGRDEESCPGSRFYVRLPLTPTPA